MEIKILGTRANIKTHKQGHSFHSGILIDNKFMIDIGEKHFLQYQPKYIFITHFHPDHAFFIKENEAFNSKIYAPEEHPLADDVVVFNTPLVIDNYHFTPIPTLHSLNVKSIGMVIQHTGKKVLYTGDMAWIEKRHHHLFENLDMALADGTYLRKGGLVRQKEGKIYGHTGIPNIIKMLTPYTNKIIFLHLGTWWMKGTDKDLHRLKALNTEMCIEVARDGDVFVIDD